MTAAVANMPDTATLLARMRRRARHVEGLAGSLALHAVAALAVVLLARAGAPPPPDPWTVELVIEQAPAAVQLAAPEAETTAAAPPPEPAQPSALSQAPSEPMRAVPTEQLALDLPMPDEAPPVEIDAHPEVEIEPPPEAPRRKPAAPRPAVTAAEPPSLRMPAPAMTEPAPPAAVAPPAATAAPPASVPPAAPRQASRYGPILLAWLERYRDYPRAARLRRQEGEVLLRLTVDRAGRLLGAEIARPSGVDALDQAALDTARRAAPMPPVPADEPGERLILLVPVLFALAKG